MNRLVVGISIILLLLLSSLLFASPALQDLSLRAMPPSSSHPLGTDTLGRDLLRRCSSGFLLSFSTALVSSLFSLFLGMILSLFLCRKTGPSLLASSLVNAAKVMPPVILALFFSSVFAFGWWKVVAAIAISYSAHTARVLAVKVRETIGSDVFLSLRAAGLGKRRIFFHHLLPSLCPILIEEGVSVMMGAVLTESSLSFMGMGLPSGVATLGGIVAEGRALILSRPHIMISASIYLVLFGTALVLVSGGLSELDPSSH